ncbi:MAG: redoxin domain-containing protein [Nannocystaceae bacterium]|nr:redoxin domain-containing protein [Nannocystaceae bacterium]
MMKTSRVFVRGAWLRGCALSVLAPLACASEPDAGVSDTAYTTASSVGDDGAVADRCSGTPADDVMVAQPDRGITLSGDAIALASAERGVVACGDGFFDLVEVDAGDVGTTALDGRCSAIAVSGDIAVVGTAQGDVIAVDLTGPIVLGRATVPGPVHGVAMDGGDVWIAAGDAGVHAMGLATGAFEDRGTLGDVADARGVALLDGALWVAAGAAGVVVLAPGGGATTGSVATDSPALGLRAGDGDVAVLRGVFGWDRFEGGSSPSRSGGGDTTGTVLDAVQADGTWFTVESHAIVRHGGDARHDEERPQAGALTAPWWRAAVAHGDAIWGAIGDTLLPIELGAAAAAPDVAVDGNTLYLWGDPGAPVEALLVVDNHGDAPLRVGSLEVEAPFVAAPQDAAATADCPDAFEVPPGGSSLVSVSYTPSDDALVSGTLVLHTNDPDEPTVTITIDGNRGEPELGVEATDFLLPGIDGTPFRLSDHRGKVVLVKMFNFGCKRCSEEFATVEHELMASYPGSDFLAVGVNTTHRTAFAGQVVAEGGLTLPMTLDLDSAAFRHYRMPQKVFPLNVVVDRDGVIVHVDTEEGLASTRTAIEAAL